MRINKNIRSGLGPRPAENYKSDTPTDYQLVFFDLDLKVAPCALDLLLGILIN